MHPLELFDRFRRLFGWVAPGCQRWDHNPEQVAPNRSDDWLLEPPSLEEARLINTVRERQIPAIFCESTVSDKNQRQVAAESGARFGGTFYVDSLSTEDGPAPSLLKLQRHNVELLIRGLSADETVGN